MKDLSIIIISFNTEKLTRECIESVFKNTKGIEFEIIVVDNDSKDGSVQYLKSLETKKSQVKVILNKENTGFGQANNQGMKLSRGRYILLLNSDTLVTSNVLADLVSWMDKNEKVGVSSCALKFPDGRIQGTGGFFPTLGRVFAWMTFLDDIPGFSGIARSFHPMHGLSPLDRNESFFESEKEMDWVTGAFFMMRRDVYEKAGGFDRDYFMYVEEVDLCFRIRKAGYLVRYLPKWSIIHYGGASSTNEFPLINEVKGLKTFYRKHYPIWQMLPLRILLKLGALLRIFVFGVIRGFGAAKTYAKIFITA